MPEPTRNPAMGLNSNLSINGAEYHVQTEDLVLKSKVRTQVFVDGGRVLHTDQYSYNDHLNTIDLTARLIKVMRACHQKVVRMVEQGALVINQIPPPSTRSLTPVSLVVNQVALVVDELPLSTPATQPPESRVTRVSPVVKPKTQSEVWDSVVKEARRMDHRRVRLSSRPPLCWDQVVEKIRKSG
jgi:hypothetical protein